MMLFEELWEKFLVERSLPKVNYASIIDAIKSKYAKGSDLTIKFVPFSGGILSKLPDSASTEISQGFGAYFGDGASSQFRRVLLIDKEKLDDIFKVIEVLLHEITHYNQDLKWTGMDKKDRITYIQQNLLKSVPLDKDTLKHIINLNYTQLISYLEEVFGYNDSPIEKEAYSFADKHFGEALHSVLPKDTLMQLAVARKDKDQQTMKKVAEHGML